MSKRIMLKSSDGESFEVDEAIALQSQTVAHLVEDDCASNGVPLANVTSKILVKVIEYCKKHVEADSSSDETTKADLDKWDAEFMDVDQSTLYDLILAANYLNIASLLDLACQTVADMIKGKSADQIRARTISHPRKKKRFAKRINGLLNEADYQNQPVFSLL